MVTERRLLFESYNEDGFPIILKHAGGNRDAFHDWHCHDFYEFVFISHGSGVHHIAKNVYPMFQGDFYLMNPDDHHSYMGDDEYRIINILLSAEIKNNPLMEDVLHLPGIEECFFGGWSGSKHKIHLAPRHERLVTVLCNRMFEEQEKREMGWHQAMFNGMRELLLCISRAWTIYGANEALEYLAPGPVAKSIAIIYKEYKQVISVDDLAQRVHLSSNYFGEIFKQQTGLSVQRYINKHRVDRSRVLLEASNKTVTEIALSVGYDDPNYFTRIFKKFLGITPREYRKCVVA